MRKKKAYHPYGGRRKHPLLWTLGILLAAGLIGYGILEGVVLAHDETNITGSPQYMLLLGAQVMPDGRPSVLLADRLETALDYLEANPEVTVIVSGGQGRTEPTTEAETMGDYLVERGIDEARIWREGNSYNTAQNVRNTVALLEEMGVESREVLVVSNGFHLARARLLGERYGLEVSTLAAPSSHAGAKLKNYLREPFALVKSFLFD